MNDTTYLAVSNYFSWFQSIIDDFSFLLTWRLCYGNETAYLDSRSLALLVQVHSCQLMVHWASCSPWAIRNDADACNFAYFKLFFLLERIISIFSLHLHVSIFQANDLPSTHSLATHYRSMAGNVCLRAYFFSPVVIESFHSNTIYWN